MSLTPQKILPIPEMTRQVAQAAFARGNVYLQMRDTFGTLFSDDQFVDMYPADGQPAYSPWRLALVSVMQFAENLTDRQAADAVRSRIDWKYALSLDLTDTGFDFSILSEFRQRLLTHGASERLFNEVLRQFGERGLLKGTGKQRTDSTHVFASIARLNRLELIGRTLQHALDELSQIVPEWLQTWVDPVWYSRYGQVLSEYRLPKSEKDRDQLALQIGQDGHQLWAALYRTPTVFAMVRHLPAIQTLHQVWIQQFVVDEGRLRWRKGGELPPAHRLIKSPFDRQARYSRKRETEWVGYKVHLTETCHPDHVNLVTHVLTTPASTADITVLDEIHHDLHAQDRLPDEHYVDGGYMSAQELFDAQQTYDVNLMGFIPGDPTPQKHTGYDITAFSIDWDTQQVTCPQGHTTSTWNRSEDGRRTTIRAAFPKSACQPCPVRSRCTSAQRRHVSFPPQGIFEARERRRVEQTTRAFQIDYQKRSGIEGTVSEGAFVLGMRRSRYRGLDKTHLQHVMTATAMNLTRAMNWLNTNEKSQARKTRFGRLLAA